MNSLPKIKNLESKRLILRKLNVKDAESLYDYAKIPSVTKYVFWDHHKTIKDSIKFINTTTKEYKQDNRLMWAIQLKDQPGIIGTCGFMAHYPVNKSLEIGYTFNPKYWHHGYAQEALKTIIDYTFETMDIIRIEGICVEENQSSAKVMLKCHMTYEGLLKDAFIKNGDIKNCKIFAITKREWMTDTHKN